MLPLTILLIAIKETQTQKYSASELNGLREKLGLLTKESPLEHNDIGATNSSEADEVKTSLYSTKGTLFARRLPRAGAATIEDKSVEANESSVELTTSKPGLKARRLLNALESSRDTTYEHTMQ